MGTESPNEKQSWLTENDKDDEEAAVKSNGTVHVRYGNKSCWSRRTTVERRLVYVILLCLALAVGLIVALAIVSSKDSNDEASSSGVQSPEVCTSIDCVVAAARVAESIDFSVSPCEDFYTFACGSWMDKHVIPDDKSEVNTFSILRDEVEVILKNILEDNKTYSDLEVLNKPKALYASCMGLEKIEEVGDAPLRTFMEQLGGWPMVTPHWDSTNYSLTDLLVRLNMLSNYPVVAFYVGVDLKNSSSRIIVMDQPGFGLPGRKYYLVPRNDSNLAAYETLMRNIAVALGADPATVDGDITAVVDFEIELANISVPSEDRRDSEKLYNLYTLPELASNFSGAIDWISYFNQIFNHSDVNVPLDADEPIVNRSPEYYARVLELLKNTPDRTVVNYVVWRIVMNRASTLSEKYRDFFLDYDKVVYGTAAARSRFRTCASYVTSYMGLAVGHMFVDQAFDEQAKDMALEMIVELKKAFNELLLELDWMDDETKVVAREKNDYINEKIGYPEEVLNITYLTQLYENYTYNVQDYFNNVVTNLQQSVRFSLRQLREPVDRDQWGSAPSTVNAYYNSQRNQIMFPAGILQPPFFSKTYPKSLNFGAIGVVIGHEITHGFDDRGRQYDKQGNLQQWWSDQAIEKFKGRAQCIINQYGNYTVPEADMNLNGVNTQGENIADNGGLKQSYRAYRNWVRDQRKGVEEQLLPGLDFDNNQLFFINFAQIWCSNMRKESAMNRILTGVHSPGRFRVIGSLQNSMDFAEAFSCAKGSYMNPEAKCVVW